MNIRTQIPQEIRSSVPGRSVPARSGVPKNQRKTVAGYFLLEAYAYAALWALVAGLGFAMFSKSLDHWSYLTRNSEEIVRVMKAGEQWRQDIRSATAELRVIEEEGAFALEIPNASGTTIYLVEKDMVWRRTGQDGPWRRVLTGLKQSRMERSPRQHTEAWAWEIELQRHKKQKGRMRPLFSFLAVAPERSEP